MVERFKRTKIGLAIAGYAASVGVLHAVFAEDTWDAAKGRGPQGHKALKPTSGDLAIEGTMVVLAPLTLSVGFGAAAFAAVKKFFRRQWDNLRAAWDESRSGHS